jgi:hypothetical protein
MSDFKQISAGEGDHSCSPERSGVRWATIGFVLGAALPVGLGVHMHYELNAYVASQPPGTFVCGLPGLVPIGLIFGVGPFLGCIGAMLGRIAEVLVFWRTL